MAFPTSGLTNNLVHKEGNRAFVYDSTLGVWDQIRETDRTENKIQSGTIGSGVTFPAGHVVQVISGHRRIEASTNSTTWVSIHSALKLPITPSSTSHKIFIMFSVPSYINTTSTYHTHTIFRDSTNLGGGGSATGDYGFGMQFGSDSADSMAVNNGSYLDSPNTIGVVEYEIYHRVSAGIGYSMMNNTSASITLMEIVV